MAAVTANVLRRSPRGQQWCRAIGLRFVNFRDRVPDVAARQARFRTIQARPKDRQTLSLSGWKMRQTD
jgi:hypothetical protein